jgi:hypothetical protein
MIVKLNLVSNTGPTDEKQVGSDRQAEQSSVIRFCGNYCKVTVSSVRGGLRLIVLGRLYYQKVSETILKFLHSVTLMYSKLKFSPLASFQ